MSRSPSLRNSRTLRGLREDVRLIRGLLARRAPATVETDARAERERRIQDYLASHEVRKLQLGAGTYPMSGWLATDVKPRRDQVLPVDARKPLPIPDASIDYIHAEHLFEHIRYPAGQRLLKECWRVLRPGGVLRIATPDFARLIAIYRGDAGPEGDHYLDHMFEHSLKYRPHRHPVFLLNHLVRAWGHLFLYDEELLARCLAEAGYVDITPCALGESEHRHLRDVERHGGKDEQRRRAVTFETMILEATKPVATPA
jgi:predicted SAM-dependent methyltransferase